MADSTRGKPKGPPDQYPSGFGLLVRNFKVFSSILFIVLGTIIVTRAVFEKGALYPTLIGVSLIGLGVARLWAMLKASDNR
jgi:hypothetical protein